MLVSGCISATKVFDGICEYGRQGFWIATHVSCHWWLSFNFLGGSGGSGDEAEPLLRPCEPPLGKSSGARGTAV